MNKDEQIKHFDFITARMKLVLIDKGDDYSWADRLSNFKTVAAICQISPEIDCLALIATKVARLWVLFKTKTPKNESIEDSILDLANYAILLSMIYEEQKTASLKK